MGLKLSAEKTGELVSIIEIFLWRGDWIDINGKGDSELEPVT